MNLIWVLLIVAVVVLDMTTSNILYSWMSVGFLGAMVVDYLGYGLPAQIITACVLGAIFFIIGTYVSNRFIKKDIPPTTILVDKIIGTVHVAKKVIGEDTQYNINGVYWNLKNDGPDIQVGEKFRITGIKSNKLQITKEN